MKQLNYRKYFLRTLIFALSIGAVIGIYIFLFGEFGDMEVKLLLTTLAFGGVSLTGLCCSTVYNREELKIMAVIGMIFSIITLVLACVAIWGESIEILNKFLASVVVTFAIAHISLLHLVKPRADYVKHMLYTTVMFIVIVSVMLLIPLLIEFNLGEFHWRLLGVFAILDVLGTIVTPILNKNVKKNL